jgi:hypothetical protein
MRYLKKFNEEYNRTIGFRYSEPKIEMKSIGVYNGYLTPDILKKSFDEFGIKSNSPKITKEKNSLDDFEVDGQFEINFFVYNDRKDDILSLITDVGDYLASKEVFIKVLDIKKES